MTSSVIYRHFAEDGQLLYVGVSDCIEARTRQHAIYSPWFREVARTETQVCISRDHALALERVAIRFEMPRENQVHACKVVKVSDEASAAIFSGLIEATGGAEAFAAEVLEHPLAPEGKPLTRDAVYMWKTRKRVPFMWRPAVRAIAAENLPDGAA